MLVILGLLTGGILAGQSLIRAAELRSVSTDAGRYFTSIQSFRDRYFALPGDMTNAVKFWGAQAGATTDGVDATCRALTTPATGTLTCNGDGDGYVTGMSGTQLHEQYRAFQHLANAGLIEGNFTGVSGHGLCCSDGVVGENLPKSKVAQAGFGLRAYLPRLDAATDYFAGDYGNTLLFGTPPATGTAALRVPTIKPEEAWNIDTKIDDGKPATGKVVVPESLTTCHTNTEQTSTYALSTSDIACTFLIKY